MKIVIILNPAAGRGAGTQRRAWLQEWIDEAGLDAQIWETQGAGEAIELARRAAGEAELVVAAGGDGTLGEVLNGIYGSGAKLGVLPLGTGNDFARCIGIGADLNNGTWVIENGEPRHIDIGKVTLAGQSRYFMNVAGAGFDSRCALRINEHRPKILGKLSGTGAYLVAVAAEIGSFQCAKLHLELDGRTVETPAVLCAIANAQSYGGGMKVAPDADLCDGLFDICLIKDVSRVEFLRAFPGVFKGQHTRHPKVEMFRAARVRLESQPPLPVLVDGEVLGTTPAQFEILPGAIEFWAPPAPQKTVGEEKADTTSKIR